MPADLRPAGRSRCPAANPGADVSRGVAISADGQKVAFRTDAPVRPARRARPPTCPAGQVFVRDRATRHDDAGHGERDPDRRDDRRAGRRRGRRRRISADGTTVAWTGGNAADADPLPRRREPRPRPSLLPLAAGRGRAGRADAAHHRPRRPGRPRLPADGGQRCFDPTATGPCYGPLTDQEANRADISAQLPALSGDGYHGRLPDRRRAAADSVTGLGLDLYVTDMTPGLSRKQATVELTRDPVDFDPPTSSPLEQHRDVARRPLSRRHHGRTKFTLPALQLIGEPRTVSGPRELYMVDLADRTIERVTHSIGGGDIDGDVLNGVAVSADGSRGRVHLVRRQPLLRRRQPADRRLRRHQAAGSRRRARRKTGPGDGGPAATIEVDSGGPTDRRVGRSPSRAAWSSSRSRCRLPAE